MSSVRISKIHVCSAMALAGALLTTGQALAQEKAARSDAEVARLETLLGLSRKAVETPDGTTVLKTESGNMYFREATAEKRQAETLPDLTIAVSELSDEALREVFFSPPSRASYDPPEGYLTGYADYLEAAQEEWYRRFEQASDGLSDEAVATLDENLFRHVALLKNARERYLIDSNPDAPPVVDEMWTIEDRLAEQEADSVWTKAKEEALRERAHVVMKMQKDRLQDALNAAVAEGVFTQAEADQKLASMEDEDTLIEASIAQAKRNAVSADAIAVIETLPPVVDPVLTDFGCDILQSTANPNLTRQSVDEEAEDELVATGRQVVAQCDNIDVMVTYRDDALDPIRPARAQWHIPSWVRETDFTPGNLSQRFKVTQAGLRQDRYQWRNTSTFADLMFEYETSDESYETARAMMEAIVQTLDTELPGPDVRSETDGS